MDSNPSELNMTVINEDRAGFWKPVSWSAIFAGAVAALGAQVILTLIGTGIGAAAYNPNTDNTGMTVGAAIWLVLSGIISFGIGGYAAGHLSGFFRTTSGATHGALSWALAAVIGATVTVLAGSTTLGGAAAGVGAAAPGYSRTSYTTAAAPGADRPSEFRSALPADRGTLDRGTINEADARAAADRASKAVAGASLVTAVAFALSVISACIFGMVGRSPLRLPAPMVRPKERMAHA